MATNKCKGLYNYIKILVLGGTPKPLPFTRIIGGLPAPLSIWKDWLKSSSELEISLLLTATSLHKACTSHNLKPDLSSIEGGEDKVSDTSVEEFASFVRGTELFRKIKEKPLQAYGDLRVTSAQGVFGSSYFSIPLERGLLYKKPPLMKAISDLNYKLKRGWINEIIDHKTFQSKVNIEDIQNTVRRLAVIREPANKTRVVGIADFFSHNCLLPIHKHIMEILRDIPEDGTYRASEIISELKSNPKLSEMEITGFDVDTFTDNLSCKLQVKLLEIIFDKATAEKWFTVIREPFWFEDEKRFLSYVRGQPMGILSSWAVATLTHHFLVRFAAFKYTKGAPIDYRLLGDDNLILNKDLSEAYRKMAMEFYIPLSSSKEVSTKFTGGLEFVKRIIRGSKEFTPLPWNILMIKDKATCALELWRLLTSYWGARDAEVKLYHWFKQVADVQQSALEFYVQMLRASLPTPDLTGSQGDNVHMSWKQSQFLRAVIKNIQVLDAIDGFHDFDPTKAKARVVVKAGQPRKDVRGVIDKATQAVYYIVVLNYAQQHCKDRANYYDAIYDLWTTDKYGSPYLDWNLCKLDAPRSLEFYHLDPKKRFREQNRASVVQETMKVIQKILDRQKLWGLYKSGDQMMDVDPETDFTSVEFAEKARPEVREPGPRSSIGQLKKSCLEKVSNLLGKDFITFYAKNLWPEQ